MRLSLLSSIQMSFLITSVTRPLSVSTADSCLCLRDDLNRSKWLNDPHFLEEITHPKSRSFFQHSSSA